jgi:hypothetical protein
MSGTLDLLLRLANELAALDGMHKDARVDELERAPDLVLSSGVTK